VKFQCIAYPYDIDSRLVKVRPPSTLRYIMSWPQTFDATSSVPAGVTKVSDLYIIWPLIVLSGVNVVPSVLR
jgi:hypothetical protein